MKRNILAAGIIAGGLVIAGTTGAVAGNLITSHDIQNNTIKSRDLKDGHGVAERDLRAPLAAKINQAAQPGTQGPQGPAGPKGDTGDTGPKGDTGATGATGGPGLSNVRADEPYGQVAPAHSVFVAFATCPDGKAAISGGFRLNADQSEAFQGGGYAVPGVTAIASEPVGVQDGHVVNTYQNDAFPQDADGRFLPNAWAVTVENDTDHAQGVRAAVVCATVAG